MLGNVCGIETMKSISVVYAKDCQYFGRCVLSLFPFWVYRKAVCRHELLRRGPCGPVANPPCTRASHIRERAPSTSLSRGGRALPGGCMVTMLCVSKKEIKGAGFWIRDLVLCQRALIRRLPSVVGLIAWSRSRKFHVHGDDFRMNSLTQTSLQGVVSLQRQTPA